jgi:hypothetical protein
LIDTPKKKKSSTEVTKGRDDDDGDDGIDDHGNESDGNTFALLPGHPKSASKRAREKTTHW